MSFGTPEMLVIVVLVLLLFGPDRLPGLLKSVGRGIREIKRVTSDFQHHFDFDDDTPPRSTSRTAAQNAPVQNAPENLETIPPTQPQLPLDQAHHETMPQANSPGGVQPQNEKEREA